MQDQNTKNREIRALVEGMKEMNIQKAIIISQDDESHIVVDKKKIDIIPIHKWLLE
jgi:predicted AAA+ superfamily ATPase